MLLCTASNLLSFQALSERVFVPHRSPDGPFVFSVDHCFPIRGQGTVMTGTVLNGRVAVSDVSHTLSLSLTYHTV